MSSASRTSRDRLEVPRKAAPSVVPISPAIRTAGDVAATVAVVAVGAAVRPESADRAIRTRPRAPLVRAAKVADAASLVGTVPRGARTLDLRVRLVRGAAIRLCAKAAGAKAPTAIAIVVVAVVVVVVAPAGRAALPVEAAPKAAAPMVAAGTKEAAVAVPRHRAVPVRAASSRLRS